MARTQTSYRPDIDGLRAVAIVAVIVYHAAPGVLPGGFIGVDVFFVVSGFLITGILLDPDRRPTLREFFARRIRRLLPALVLVLATSLIVGWWILLPHEFAELAREAAAAAGFSLNFLLWRETGYFDASAEYKPLLHLWSLSIEEQFYLIWPVALVAFDDARRAKPLLLAIALSFVLGLWWIVPDPAGAFYLLPPRLWELLAGAALSALHTRARPRLYGARALRLSDLVSIAGFAAIALACVALGRGHRYPGFAALLPVLGTCGVIAAGPRAGVNRVLAWPAFVAIGLVSYPLYLWHWPALSLARMLEGREPDTGHKAIVLAIAACLAVLTYFLIERPIRRRRLLTVPLLGALIVAGAAAGVCLVAPVLPRLDDPLLMRYDAAAHDWDFPGPIFKEEVAGGLHVWAAGSGPTVLVLGDSNAQQYGPRFTTLLMSAAPPQARVVFATTGNCPPIPGVRARRGCAAYIEQALQYAHRPEVSAVVFAAQWTGYLNEAGLAFEYPDGASAAGEAARAATSQAFAAMVRELRAAGKAVYLVLNIPVAPQLDPRYVLWRHIDGRYTLRDRGIDRAVWAAAVAPVVAPFARAAQAAGATLIDPVPSLCDERVCPSVDADGEPRYRDGFHLRARFVRDHATWIDRVLAPAPATPR